MQFLRNASLQMDAVIAAARQFRKVITEGVVGDPTPNWPAQFAGSPADPTPDTGVFQRLDDLVKRIRASKGYTDEVGALLGIIPSKSDPIAPEELKPELSVVALPGNIIQVHFKRGTTNGVDLQLQLDNEVIWNNQGRFVLSPALIPVPENPQGLPRAVQVRGATFRATPPSVCSQMSMSLPPHLSYRITKTNN